MLRLILAEHELLAAEVVLGGRARTLTEVRDGGPDSSESPGFADFDGRVMLLRQDTLDSIARGEISLAFRRWRRPTVRSGGTLLTGAGQLQIGLVTIVGIDAITAEEARRAGYSSREVLLADLGRCSDGDVYRIELGRLAADRDVDLMVEFAPGAKNFDRFIALADLREARLGRRVELFTTEALTPFIGPRILAEAKDVLRVAGLRGPDTRSGTPSARVLTERWTRRSASLAGQLLDVSPLDTATDGLSSRSAQSYCSYSFTE